jgi:hypothetical protein
MNDISTADWIEILANVAAGAVILFGIVKKVYVKFRHRDGELQ